MFLKEMNGLWKIKATIVSLAFYSKPRGGKWAVPGLARARPMPGMARLAFRACRA